MRILQIEQATSVGEGWWGLAVGGADRHELSLLNGNAFHDDGGTWRHLVFYVCSKHMYSDMRDLQLAVSNDNVAAVILSLDGGKLRKLKRLLQDPANIEAAIEAMASAS